MNDCGREHIKYQRCGEPEDADVGWWGAVRAWANRLKGMLNKERDEEEERKKEEERQKEEDKKRQRTLILSELKRIMDPLIATHVFNTHYIPIGRLPNELLLRVFDHVGDDVDLACLGLVSRRFRGLINKPHGCLTSDVHYRLRSRILTDGLCDECKIFYDVPVKGWSRNLDQLPYRSHFPRRSNCQFGTRGKRKLHCDGCGNDHSAGVFSYFNQRYHKEERQCYGREGAVRLCEHVHISWAGIESHIDHWRRQDPGGWHACFDHPVAECRHFSHDYRYMAEEGDEDAPWRRSPPLFLSWPRAVLRDSEEDGNRVVFLNLQWSPHIPLSAFTGTLQGRVLAPEMRALLRKYRQGAASVIMPAHPSTPLPEMACFKIGHCSCLCYEAAAGEEEGADVDSLASIYKTVLDGCAAPTPYCTPSGHLGSHGHANVYICRQFPWGPQKPQCLTVSYARDIYICRRKSARSSKINPPHSWFHAMDPNTYPRLSNYNARPRCKDIRCLNYYRNPSFFVCHSSRGIHHSCPLLSTKSCAVRDYGMSVDIGSASTGDEGIMFPSLENLGCFQGATASRPYPDDTLVGDSQARPKKAKLIVNSLYRPLRQAGGDIARRNVKTILDAIYIQLVEAEPDLRRIWTDPYQSQTTSNLQRLQSLGELSRPPHILHQTSRHARSITGHIYINDILTVIYKKLDETQVSPIPSNSSPNNRRRPPPRALNGVHYRALKDILIVIYDRLVEEREIKSISGLSSFKSLMTIHGELVRAGAINRSQ